MTDDSSAERLKYFSDAVVAIALTLLVLPLTDVVPEFAAEHAPAMDVVTKNWAKIFSFLLSFTVIGRFWLIHHRIFEHVRRYSHALMTANFCWLLTIVVLPFPTELVGTYQTQRFTAVFYLGTIFASSLCHAWLIFIIRRDPKVRGDAEPVTDQWILGFWLAIAITALAVVVAFIHPSFGYYILLLLLVPPIISRLRSRTQPD